MSKQKQKPAELELLILKVLWQASPDELPLPVREIRTRLAICGRDIAHTTVITTLGTMLNKRFVKRSKYKNSFRFEARVSEKDIQGSAIADLLGRVFDGSAESLMLALFESNSVDRQELEEIKKLINQKSKEAKNRKAP